MFVSIEFWAQQTIPPLDGHEGWTVCRRAPPRGSTRGVVLADAHQPESSHAQRRCGAGRGTLGNRAAGPSRTPATSPSTRMTGTHLVLATGPFARLANSAASVSTTSATLDAPSDQAVLPRAQKNRRVGVPLQPTPLPKSRLALPHPSSTGRGRWADDLSVDAQGRAHASGAGAADRHSHASGKS